MPWLMKTRSAPCAAALEFVCPQFAKALDQRLAMLVWLPGGPEQFVPGGRVTVVSGEKR